MKIHKKSGFSFSKRSGFTLLEVMISFGLLGILVIALTMLFSQGVKAFRHGNKSVEIHQNARNVMDRVQNELASAFVGSGYKFEGKSSGTQTDTFGPEVYFMAPLDNSGDCDLVEVAYWLRSADNMLMRYTHVADKTSMGDFGQYTGGASDTIASNVVSLDIEYYNGTNWVSTWNSTTDLPKAVKMIIKTAGNDAIKKYSGSQLLDNSVTFENIIRLRNVE